MATLSKAVSVRKILSKHSKPKCGIIIMEGSKKRAWQTSLERSFSRLNATINAVKMGRFWRKYSELK